MPALKIKSGRIYP